MNSNKILGPILALLLAIGIGAAIYKSAVRKADDMASKEAAAAVAEVKGMIGSEKESFFLDPRVVDILQSRYNLRVKIEKVGSREIAGRSLTGYDFAFPAGSPAAIALQKQSKAKQVYTTFFTPIVIASWKTLIPVLEKEGLVKNIDGNFYITDMKRLFGMIEKGTRWKELKDNNSYATSKSILINSTDVRKSNSAAMYLALASYVANDNNVVEDSEQANKVLPLVTSLFMRQGLQESSSAGPFEDYTTMGIGKEPLVVIYESQFLEYQSKRDQPNKDMVLLYPQPTIFTKHILVPLSANGDKLGNALATDADLQKLAAQYGYRTARPEQFADFLKEKKLSAPITLVDVIDPPSFEMIERMIQSIEQKFQ